MDPIGLAASIVTFVDFSAKVVARLHEFNSRTSETPETFRTLIIQLPLLTVILQRIRHQASIGHVDTVIAKALKPVIDETSEQTRYLGERLDKIIPPQNASKLEIGLKALKSIVSESRVEKALDNIHECVNLLVLHQTTSSTDISANILNELQRLGDSPQPTASYEDTTALLHEAAKQGQISSIRSILRLPTDVNSPDECGRTPLHTAASSGQKEVVRRLCFWKADVHVEDDFGQTPLHVAIAAGDMGIAKILLDKGANLDIEDDSGKKPLDYAKPSFLTRWRIRHGIAMEAKDPNTGNTALIQAALHGDPDTVTLLVQEGARVEAKNQFGRTALAEACIRGHTEVASILLDYNANPNATDSANCSPVSYCIQYDQAELLQMLLDTRRVSLETTYTKADRRTPLMMATFDHKWHIAETLLQHGANPNVKCAQARSPMRNTVLWCRDESVLARLIELCLARNVDINIPDGDGWTPLAEAVNGQKFATMHLLLKHGASPYGRVEEYPYMCKLAIWDADVHWVRTLAGYGGNIDASNDDGWTALREAVHWGHIDMTCELVSLGADANNTLHSCIFCPGLESVTLLMHAVWQARIHEGTRYRRIISALVEKGRARLEDQDSLGGVTALRVAVDRGFEDVACLLFLKGANAYAVANDGRTVADVAREKKMSEFCTMLSMDETGKTCART